MFNLLRQRTLRHKLAWMAGIIFLTRVISMIPVPGIDASVFRQWATQNADGALNLFSAFTGGAFENYSVFALGVTPLITAQIAVQLLSGVIPVLDRLRQKGEHGKKVMKRITDTAAIVLAAIQSCCMAVGFGNNGLISGNGLCGILLTTVSMTAGSAVMIWLAEVLTRKAIGNGVSILLMSNIVSGLPEDMAELFTEITAYRTRAAAALFMAGAVLILVAMIVATVCMSEGCHPLPVQYSQKLQIAGEACDTGEIPVRAGISGVMPVVFASSVMAVPQLIAAIAGKGYGSGYSKILLNMMLQKNWFNGENEIYSFGLLIYLALILFFAFYYLPVTFNGAEIADILRRFGAFIPGVRAGRDTEIYITGISRHMAATGVVMLILITTVPMILCGELGLESGISGSSIIIVTGVMMELLEQIRLETAGNSCHSLLPSRA